MSIELTDEIEKLLQPFSASEKNQILKRAWDACCAGEFLYRLGITYDAWDGKHEADRVWLEKYCVEKVIYFLD